MSLNPLKPIHDMVVAINDRLGSYKDLMAERLDAGYAALMQRLKDVNDRMNMLYALDQKLDDIADDAESLGERLDRIESQMLSQETAVQMIAAMNELVAAINRGIRTELPSLEEQVARHRQVLQAIDDDMYQAHQRMLDRMAREQASVDAAPTEGPEPPAEPVTYTSKELAELLTQELGETVTYFKIGKLATRYGLRKDPYVVNDGYTVKYTEAGADAIREKLAEELGT